MSLFIIMLISASFNAFTANILELDPDLALNEVPEGTEIRVKLPEGFKDSPLPLTRAGVYSTNIYFEDGKLEILQDKVKRSTSTLESAKKPSASTPLCRLSLKQWGSSKLTSTGDTLVLTVNKTNRNLYFPSLLDGRPSFAVLYTNVRGNIEGSVSLPAISCQSGYLKGIFTGLTVGKFIKTFGVHLEGKKQIVRANSHTRGEAINTSARSAIKEYRRNADRAPLDRTNQASLK